MRPFGELTAFDEALERLLGAVRPIWRAHDVALDEADGRVAAIDLIAAEDVPGFDRAAMDGYAVRAVDTDGADAATPKLLNCATALRVGEAAGRSLEPGVCMEIPTGAPLPPGADAVVIVEHTSRRGDGVEIHLGVRSGQNVAKRGSDVRAGETVLSAGTALTPAALGAIAAAGHSSVTVFDRPVVTIISTGAEVVADGAPLGAGQVRDINRHTVGAAVKRHGGVPRHTRAAKDDVDDLVAALARARTSDFIVLSGGTSVGPRDLAVDAVRAAGGDVLFHGISIKPGKPTLGARLGATIVLGLPGYPASCLTNAYLLLVPAIRRRARLPDWRPRTVELPLGRAITSASGRRHFYTVRISDGAAQPAFKSSGDITSMAHADGYIDIPAETQSIDAGTLVKVMLFD